MQGYKYQARLQVMHYSVTFETDWKPSYDYLREIDRFFGYEYHFTEREARPVDPVVRYVNDTGYHAVYLPDQKAIVVRAPWEEIPKTDGSDHELATVLVVPIWSAAEITRQELGEYFFHASAVVRDDRAIVLSGAPESGKTILALHLCLNHGFSLYANDEVLITLHDGSPHLRGGDALFHLRYSSLREYAPRMASRVFGCGPPTDRAWELKKSVPPAHLGVREASGLVPISRFLFLTLDSGMTEAMWRVVDGSDPKELFEKKIYFHTEMSAGIRGLFAPLDGGLSSIPFFLPSFDCPAFLRTRSTLIEVLFGRGAVATLRGPLDRVVELLDPAGRRSSHTLKGLCWDAD